MTRMTVIFRKEFKDTIRDRRTLILLLVVPLVVIPLLIGSLAKIAQRMSARAEAEVSTVGLVGESHAPELVDLLRRDSLFALVPGIDSVLIDSLIRTDSLDGVLLVPPRFEMFVDTDQQAKVAIYYKSSNALNVTQRRLTDAIEEYDQIIVNRRVARMGLDENLFDAIAIDQNDVSTLQEVLGKTIGGFLPYMFVLLCFTGSLYPGLDLGAGEKERGTLETILSSPATRLEIVLGKFVVVTLFGLVSALASIAGLYLGVRTAGEIPENVSEVISSVLTWEVVAMLGSLLVPVAIFFGAVILAVSINAKSYKEGQSALTPLTFLLIAPVAIGLLPGIELDVGTALVPILNVSLATKEVIAGTIDPGLLALTFVSLLVLAALGLGFCVWRFNQESTLFRT